MRDRAAPQSKLDAKLKEIEGLKDIQDQIKQGEITNIDQYRAALRGI